MGAKHSAQTASDGIHIAHAYEVADATARNALSVTAADIGKIARQGSSAPYTFWILQDDTGPDWEQIDSSSVSVAHSATTGQTENDHHNRQHSITSGSDHTFPGGTTTFLRADGSFAAPSASITSSSVSASGSTSTTSDSYVLANSMTLTPGAGTYLVLFGMTFEADDDHFPAIAIYANGSKVAGTDRSAAEVKGGKGDDELESAETHCIVTVGAGEEIEGRWLTRDGTAYASARRLDLVQLS